MSKKYHFWYNRILLKVLIYQVTEESNQDNIFYLIIIKLYNYI